MCEKIGEAISHGHGFHILWNTYGGLMYTRSREALLTALVLVTVKMCPLLFHQVLVSENATPRVLLLA